MYRRWATVALAKSTVLFSPCKTSAKDHGVSFFVKSGRREVRARPLATDTPIFSLICVDFGGCGLASGDPYTTGCRSDERPITFTNGAGGTCSPFCSPSSPCPTHVPVGTTAIPECAATLGNSTPNLCVLVCGNSGSVKCPPAATCQESISVCTYVVGPSPPHPRPPRPPPAPRKTKTTTTTITTTTAAHSPAPLVLLPTHPVFFVFVEEVIYLVVKSARTPTAC